MSFLSRSLALPVLLTGLTVPAMAQTHHVPPPPKPAVTTPMVSGPSLGVTMDFIQAQVLKQGPINFALMLHDLQTGADSVAQFSVQTTGFPYDLAKCTFSYRVNVNENDGHEAYLETGDLHLSDIAQFQVMDADSWWGREMADEGAPTKSARVSPPYYVVALSRSMRNPSAVCQTSDGTRVQCPVTLINRVAGTWGFRDRDSADRVAKALTHAVELCGGGKKDPF
ncbi:MAG: hypothetical protein WBY53_06995 [Acidobacteriaceae bacterium]